MLKYEPKIVHFCGHGSGQAGLHFLGDDGMSHMVSAEALAGLFKLFSDSLECVVLNACTSEVQANAIAEHVPYVIGMKNEIGDEAAIAFAKGFYNAVAAGKPIEFAFGLACNSIQWANLPEDLTPTLKKNSDVRPTRPPVARTEPPKPPVRGSAESPKAEPQSLGEALKSLISRTADVGEIKAFVRDNPGVLKAVPQFVAGRGQIENLMDFPVKENLVPDFTRFVIQPGMSQIANQIIFVNFLSPKCHPFAEGMRLSDDIAGSRDLLWNCLTFLPSVFPDYARRAVEEDSFDIPLASLLHPMGAVLQGVLVVGRRKLLTEEQLAYLSANKDHSEVKIVTYDALIEGCE